MNTPITYSEEGAHFRISNFEYRTLDSIAQSKYGARLTELTIGRATTILSAVILAGSHNAVVLNRSGRTVVSTEMDGEEAVSGVMAQLHDPLLKHAVMDIGRVTAKVIKREEIDTEDAVPIFEFEVISRAHKWARNVVTQHNEYLYQNGEQVPVITRELLEEMPERGKVALALKGLILQSNEALGGTVNIVRLPGEY